MVVVVIKNKQVLAKFSTGQAVTVKKNNNNAQRTHENFSPCTWTTTTRANSGTTILVMSTPAVSSINSSVSAISFQSAFLIAAGSGELFLKADKYDRTSDYDGRGNMRQ